MSDDDEDDCRMFGTALPELREDVVPTKKPITVADQIAVDENGRRRFHGAFTGGFSAGFWNTVGSKEGWQPQAFKSSRHEKASRVIQAPNDFMDAEDQGEFGIAPQRIQTTDDFTAESSSSSNRKRPAEAAAAAASTDAGPIMGTPVLNLFLKPAKDKASVSLLKKMGWRENQGIGSRLTRKEKRLARDRAHKESKGQRVYNCDMGPMAKAPADDADDVEMHGSESASSDSDIDEITFAPDDYEPLVHAFKTNRFGLGYIGLNKNPVLQQHMNLFAPFEVLDKKNKKLSITGQAFGVGAFEEDDDDIYAKEDLTTYDFSLEDKRPDAATLKAIEKQKSNVIDGFAPSTRQQQRKLQYTVTVPDSFRPRNWAMRKTRFGPAIVDVAPATEVGHRRHMLTAEERGQILNDEVAVKIPPAEPSQPMIIIDERAPKEVKKDEFIELEPASVQVVADAPAPPPPAPPAPKQSAALEKLSEMFGDRFVSEKKLLADDAVAPAPPPPAKKYELIMKRTKTIWSPCPLLCQKMNIAEPMSTKANPMTNKSGGFSLFECLSGGSQSGRVGKRNRNQRNRRRDEEREFTPAIKTDDENSALVLPPASTKPPNIPRPASSVAVVETQPPPPLKPQTKIVSVAHSQKPQPKTELEIKAAESESKHPAEKKDIYKAIFDSSSSDSSDTEADGNNVADDAGPKRIATTIIPKMPKDVNVLRNTSPPRGIFANFFNKPTEPSVLQLPTPPPPPPLPPNEDIEMYGPSLPVTNKPPANVEGVAPPPRHTFTARSSSSGVGQDVLSFSSFLRKPPTTETVVKNISQQIPQKLVVKVASTEPETKTITNDDDDDDEWVDKSQLIAALQRSIREESKKSSGGSKKAKKEKHKKSKKLKKDKRRSSSSSSNKKSKKYKQ